MAKVFSSSGRFMCYSPGTEVPSVNWNTTGAVSPATLRYSSGKWRVTDAGGTSLKVGDVVPESAVKPELVTMGHDGHGCPETTARYTPMADDMPSVGEGDYGY